MYLSKPVLKCLLMNVNNITIQDNDILKRLLIFELGLYLNDV